MSRLARGRLWLGAALVGASMCAASCLALLRSCSRPPGVAFACPALAQLRADFLMLYPMKRSMR